MECKYELSYGSSFSVLELIDTLWNVNSERIRMFIENLELIDTLWNVNPVIKSLLHYMMHELIDTLWNVNDCNKNMVLCFLSRINRYIMECK